MPPARRSSVRPRGSVRGGRGRSRAVRWVLSCGHAPPSPQEAVGPHRTRTADGDVPFLRAIPGDPRVTKDKVVFHRVEGVDPAQGFTDLLHGRPGTGASAREPEVVRDPVDVLVERYLELPGRHAPPEPEVRISVAYHPPNEQREPLTGAPPRVPRAREERAVSPRWRAQARA